APVADVVAEEEDLVGPGQLVRLAVADHPRDPLPGGRVRVVPGHRERRRADPGEGGRRLDLRQIPRGGRRAERGTGSAGGGAATGDQQGEHDERGHELPHPLLLLDEGALHIRRSADVKGGVDEATTRHCPGRPMWGYRVRVDGPESGNGQGT